MRMKNDQIVHQAIEREISLGKFILSGYSEKMGRFEKKYKMKTSSFIRLFEKGKMGDEQDYFEWFALYKGKKHWEQKLSVLTEEA
jgi:hypothetical protein